MVCSKCAFHQCNCKNKTVIIKYKVEPPCLIFFPSSILKLCNHHLADIGNRKGQLFHVVYQYGWYYIFVGPYSDLYFAWCFGV